MDTHNRAETSVRLSHDTVWSVSIHNTWIYLLYSGGEWSDDKIKRLLDQQNANEISEISS